MRKFAVKANGFTLIEMLAVMFIMGIILSITVPAFGPMMRTLKLTTTAENLANVLESARQCAMTSGKNCYVVFPITGDLAYKAYKLYSYGGQTQKTVGKVEMLPNGLQIDSQSTFLTQGTYALSVPFPEDTDANINLRYILFKPNGKAHISATVKIVDLQSPNTFNCVTFYNSPTKVKVWDPGFKPGQPEEWEEQ